jgi:hypothetical protein
MEKHYDFTLIDFNELRNQKRTLLALIDDKCLEGRIVQITDDLNGIVQIVDSIQDYACAELNYDPKDVFDLTDENLDYYPEPLSDGGTIDGHIHPDEPEEETYAREMADIIYDLHRDCLYDYEAMSEEFVETILNDPANVQACKELIRKDILDDYAKDPDQFQRDPADNKLRYDESMFDYGNVIEGYCLEKRRRNNNT